MHRDQKDVGRLKITMDDAMTVDLADNHHLKLAFTVQLRAGQQPDQLDNAVPDGPAGCATVDG